MLDSGTFFSERIAKIPKHIWVTFIATIAWGLFAHLFMFSNKLVNLDDLTHMFSNLHHAYAGRWFLFFPAAISGSMSLPWVIGTLSLVYMAISACFIVSCLKIKNYLYCILAAGICCTFPVVTSTFAYMYCADTYFFSLALVCLAVFLAQKYRFGFLFAAIPICLSLGIYQSYYSICAGLFVATLAADILRNNKPIKDTIISACKYVASLGLGMILYFVVVKLTQPESGLVAYKGLERMGQLPPFVELPRLIIEAFTNSFNYYIFNDRSFHYTFLGILYAASGIATIGLIIAIIIKRSIYRQKLQTIFLICVLFVFPIACNIIYIMVPFSDIHLLMQYGLTLPPIFLLAVLEQGSDERFHWRKYSKAAAVMANWVIALTILVTTFGYTILANESYLKLHLVYEEGYSYSVTLYSRIQSSEGFDISKTIVFIGTPSYTLDLSQFGYNTDATGVLDTFSNGELTGIISSIPQTPSYRVFMKRYIGVMQPILKVDNAGIIQEDANMGQQIVTEPEILLMPVYPEVGSIAVSGEYIFVRFS